MSFFHLFHYSYSLYKLNPWAVPSYRYYRFSHAGIMYDPVLQYDMYNDQSWNDFLLLK